ncbi:MAG: substrate-binding domain-containing protein, partial [Solobacterium sp.]|nr:substrate-binding domain-containing protein [Solobacterium sp.]
MNKFLKGAAAALLSITMLAGCSSDASSAPASTGTASSAAASTPASSAAAPASSEATTPAASDDLSTKKVGICIYQFSDNFMTLFRNELESYLISQGFAKENITIVDGKNDQSEQTGQISNFITQGVDVLIINPVNSSSAETITDMVVEAGIQLVYINREPDEAAQSRWTDWNVTYVGADARQSGTMQGEIIADLGLDAVDFNGNGKIDYIMIKGDPENVDA